MSPRPEDGAVADAPAPYGGVRRTLRQLTTGIAARPVALVALIVLLVVTVACLAAPLVAPYGSNEADLAASLHGPSGAHWLGADQLGRDTLSRLLYGGRVSILYAAVVAAVALTVGVVVGLAAGYLGGLTDRVIMFATNIGMAIPVMVVVIVVLSVFQRHFLVAMVALGLLLVPMTVRSIRAPVLTIRQEQFIDAAKVSGLSANQIMVRHILPRIAGPVLVQATLASAVALQMSVGLAYLGFGPQPPDPTWGSMIAEGSRVLSISSWPLLVSGGLVALVTVCLGLVGDAIRDVTVQAWTGDVSRAARRAGRRRKTKATDVVSPSAAPATAGSNGTVPQVLTRGGLTPVVSPAGDLPADAEMTDAEMTDAEMTDAEVTGVTFAGTPIGARDDGRDDGRDDARDGAPGGALLMVRNLSVGFGAPGREVTTLSATDFVISGGEAVGLVGESGSGKTTVARALLGLVPTGGRVTGGEVWFDGQEITGLSGRRLAQFRGRSVGWIGQEPLAALDPTMRVGTLLSEVIREHGNLSRKQAHQRVLELLEMVRFPDPAAVAQRFPHQLSGGMAQRVAIARAIGNGPRLLVADEPTTALDVNVQAKILELLRDLQQELGMALLMVSHDWAVVAQVCQRAMVMYAGQLVEHGPVDHLVNAPAHPYTEALLACRPANASGESGEGRLPVIPGQVPAPGSWPVGCRFSDRCRYAMPECSAGPVGWQQVGNAHASRCLLSGEAVMGLYGDGAPMKVGHNA